MTERLFWEDTPGSGKDLIYDWLQDTCVAYDRSVRPKEILESANVEVNRARLRRMDLLLEQLVREGKVGRVTLSGEDFYWPIGLGG